MIDVLGKLPVHPSALLSRPRIISPVGGDDDDTLMMDDDGAIDDADDDVLVRGRQTTHINTPRDPREFKLALFSFVGVLDVTNILCVPVCLSV